MNSYFVTGVTGVVGSALLRKILTESDNPVSVLIRGRDYEEKLRAVFNFLNIDRAEHDGRISIINASAEDRLFNMPPAEFAAFAKSIKTIFNCAANVDLMQSLEVANRHSLDSFENLRTLLDLNPDIKLEHVSTVGVNGKQETGLSEVRVGENQRFFNSYEASKALVEKRFYLEMDKGRRITIHRPSMVVGDEKSGAMIHFQIFYFLLRLISGELTKGFIPPILDLKLDTIPSDFVAKILFASSEDDRATNKILHHCSGPERSLRLHQILTLLNAEKQKYLLPVRKTYILPRSFFSSAAKVVAHLPLDDKWKTRTELVPQLLDYASQDQIFYNQMTQKLFEGTVWPSPEIYLPPTISYYLKKRFGL